MSTVYPETDFGTSRENLACPLCGDDKVTTLWKTVKFDYGSGASVAELSAKIPVRSCAACEFQYLDVEAEGIKHNAVCRHLGVLPPDEIRQIRKNNDMSRATFSKVTGIGEASLNRWENGLTVQTHAYDRYLRLLTLPGVMQILKSIANSDPSKIGILATPRFRVLNISPGIKKEQESFQLHQAA